MRRLPFRPPARRAGLRPRAHAAPLAAPLAALVAAVVVLALAAGPATAQGGPQATNVLEIGVIASQLGSGASTGADEAAAARAFATLARDRRGLDVRVVVRDDASDPARAEAIARELVEGGAQAIVCCSTRAATARVAAWAEAARVPVLSPAPAPEPDGAEASERAWLVSLAPGAGAEARATGRRIAAEGGGAAALMALDNAFGRDAEAELRDGFVETGVTLVGTAWFEPGERPLTPDALWAITRRPAGIVVRAPRLDAVAAALALRARGWEGPIYLPSDLLDPAAAGVDPAGLGGVRVARSPAELGDGLPGSHPSAAEAAAYRGALRTVYGPLGGDRPAGARAWDALGMIAAAAEQVAVYGVPLDAGPVTRLALRDALEALGVWEGAGGVYRVTWGDASAARPEGLAWLEARAGRFRPLP